MCVLKVCSILIILHNVSSKSVSVVDLSKNPFLSTTNANRIPNISENPFLNKHKVSQTQTPISQGITKVSFTSSISSIDQNPFLTNKIVIPNSSSPPKTTPVNYEPNSVPPAINLDSNPFLSNKLVTKKPPYVPNFTYPVVNVPNIAPIPTDTSNQNHPSKSGTIPTKTNIEDSLNYLRGVCGLVDNTISLIAHGEDAVKSDYPWLGALFKSTSSEAKFLCGATLITKKHALTAGHCINGVLPTRFYLILGRSDIHNWLSGGEQIQVSDTHLHDNYIPRQGDGDIGILTLRKEVKFTSLIRPICLWSSDDNLDVIVGQNGLVVGWGVDENERFPSEPKQATLPIVSNEDCLRSHDGFRLITSNRTFCAGFRNDSGPCRGDSGSGLYIEENGRWMIRGIVSVGIMVNNTCDLRNYVVFADTSKYKDWILSYITQ